ncbi:hypothetical protein [Novosphingobium naphthalenivorans]|uniref:hypothetical protein n=1 Tax=Novosphingobium naphthalenivorans TaxID=273168 RepID=UPI0012EDC076|nr:hypothetical protein [Novosphingobium naphthalenivorans]
MTGYAVSVAKCVLKRDGRRELPAGALSHVFGDGIRPQPARQPAELNFPPRNIDCWPADRNENLMMAMGNHDDVSV